MTACLWLPVSLELAKQFLYIGDCTHCFPAE